jgi:hypothetical protein
MISPSRPARSLRTPVGPGRCGYAAIGYGVHRKQEAGALGGSGGGGAQGVHRRGRLPKLRRAPARPAQLMPPAPSGAVAAQAQDPLHAQGADTLLLVDDRPQGLKPPAERQVGVVEHRPGGDREIVAAASAAIERRGHLPDLVVTATGTTRTCRPTDPFQVGAASGFVPKPPLKLRHGFRILGQARTLQPDGLRRKSYIALLQNLFDPPGES